MGAIKRRKTLRTKEERKMRIEAVVDSEKVREKSKTKRRQRKSYRVV